VLGLSTATVVMVTGSLSTWQVVAQQSGHLAFVHWNFIHTAIIPFILFSIAITAEMERPPFDLLEAEEELSGGFNLEYASVDFAWFYLANYASLVTNSAIIVTLWLGGPNGPTINGWTVGPLWFTVKLLVVLYIFVWIRATLPRLRYDQLMDLGWKRLIPAALAMLMVVAGFQVTTDARGWFRQREWGIAAVVGALILGAFLFRAIDVGRQVTEIEASQDARLMAGERDS
jgi:NADH-quinone oxidoreductase subunit H